MMECEGKGGSSFHRARLSQVELYYRRVEGPQPDVIFLHGLTGSAWSWSGIIEELWGKARLWAVDQRGHGLSSKPGSYAPEEFTQDIVELIAHLGLHRPALVGHSMGARTAFVLAARHPELVSRLAILDLGPERSEENIRETCDFIDALPCSFASDQALIDHFTKLVPEVPLGALRSRIKEMVRGADGSLRWAFEKEDMKQAVRLARSREYWADLEAIACPTLLVRGEISTEISLHVADRMMATIKGARYVELAGTGHRVHQKDPQLMARLLADFLGLGG